MAKSWGSYTDVDAIDPATLAAVRSLVGVDAFTGKPIEKAEPKKSAPPLQAQPEPKAAAPVKIRTTITDKLLVEVPYEHTEAGHEALQCYWNENKKAPPDDFDLKSWYHAQFRSGAR
jgi:hypothetical protein